MPRFDNEGAQLDREIDQLIEHLHRFTIGLEGGYWVTMRASRVEKTPERPHGLKYALTLHGPNDERLLGYDNAHSVSDQTGPAKKSGAPIEHDHIDENGRQSRPYKFMGPFQLTEDFWKDVQRILQRERQS